MESLLEVQWSDPVARAVARILSQLPADVEQTTSAVPLGLSRGHLLRRRTSPRREGESAPGPPLPRPGYRVTDTGRRPIPAH